MIDRQPLHAGRVRLVPVSGQPNIYDMTMADGAINQGTALNKANLLKDATAALYGLPNTAVPDNVLAMLPAMINEKAKFETGSYIGTGTIGSLHPCEIVFENVPKFVAISYDDDPYPRALAGLFDVSFLSNYPNAYKAYGYISELYSRSSENAKFANKKLSWYSESAGRQLNENGVQYHWTAIG